MTKRHNKTTGINKIRSSQESSPTLNKKIPPPHKPDKHSQRRLILLLQQCSYILWVGNSFTNLMVTHRSLLFGPLWTHILFYGGSYSPYSLSYSSLRSFVLVITELQNWKLKSLWERKGITCYELWLPVALYKTFWSYIFLCEQVKIAFWSWIPLYMEAFFLPQNTMVFATFYLTILTFFPSQLSLKSQICKLWSRNCEI